MEFKISREDRGSGLISTFNGVTTLVGVTSFDDCDLNRPSIYTRVSSFTSWINQVILELAVTTTSLGPATTTTTTTTTTTEGSGGRIFAEGVVFGLILICSISLNFLN